MKSNRFSRAIAAILLAAAAYLPTSLTANPASDPALLDNFENPAASNVGTARMFIDDTSAGGKTETSYEIQDGKLVASGTITPPRGQPGWASMALLLNPDGSPADLSDYQGVALKIRVDKGNLSVSANSTEVTNFDYHAAPIARDGSKEFRDVRIDFSDMKRAWSAQTKLNLETIVSISVVAFDIQPGPFAFEIEEIRFY